jgi:hypothetical protein
MQHFLLSHNRVFAGANMVLNSATFLVVVSWSWITPEVSANDSSAPHVALSHHLN